MEATQRVSEYNSVEELVLDPSNFRLPPGSDLQDPLALCAFIEDRYDLEELGNSIARDGFRPEEPLIAVNEGDGLVVVEGNRRLSTLKLLHLEAFRNALPERRQSVWKRLAQEVEEATWDVSVVPVVVYNTRDEVEGSLGFRHVSGIAPWSAESKARYISHLVEKGHSYRDVARMIGSKADYVRRQHVAHAALNEAALQDVDVSRAERFFGVYYRSLSSPSSRDFVGVDWREAKADEPVLKNGPEPVSEFLAFLFGTSDLSPVITDSRRVDDLGRVLGDSDALDVLRSERNIDAALDVLGGDRSAVHAHLRGALRRLRQANGAAFEFAGDDTLIDLAQKCLATAQRVLEQLERSEGVE